MVPSNQKRTHRKRVSALRLSSDTTSTLPEYISPTGGWHRPEYTENIPSDTPPDYPDSAEEADEDTDTDINNALSYVPHTASSSPRAQTASSPRRPKRHKRKNSSQLYSQPQSNDSYLDSLLERSVHALEMSNTLLESSISTSTSLSAVLADDARADSTLEARALDLSSRIRGNWDVQASWSGDLNEITRRVEVLFGDEDDARYGYGCAHSREGTGGGVSCSLPSSSTRPRPHLHRPRRRPSLDLQHKSESALPRLHYSEQDRLHLVAPPPRALTQYVASTQDPESIMLPSTLGLRCPSSFHSNAEHRTFYETASSSTTSLLHSSPSLPKLNDKPLEPSTPAYNMLSSFVARAPTSSSSSTPSLNFTSFISKRRGSSTSSTEPRKSRSPDRARQDACRKGHRPMTPPAEESSSSDGCVAKQTVISLRKILDEQPQPTRSKFPSAPAFLPRTPAPVADAATSTATASISRLFTKGTHSSSTRPPSPPRHSSMKRTSGTTPSPSPTVLSIPDMLSVFGGSTPSSGRSTPKRISFAALPESYTSTRPEGSSSKFDKQKQRRRKRGGTAAGDGVKGIQESEESRWWWNGWLSGEGGTPHGLTMSLARQEERVQDRVTRNWSGRGYGGGLDEWAV